MAQRVSARELVELLRLARTRSRSETDYRRFQTFQGRLLVRHLQGEGVSLDACRVMDLGAGLGGYSIALQEAGAEVVAVDLRAHEVTGVPYRVTANAEALPFTSGRFDLIVCASLVEHLPRPQRLLVEVSRMLRSGGHFYLSFPPFYSPLGGHQFSPFHLLGEKRALAIAERFRLHRSSKWLEERYPRTPKSFAEAFGSWGLYPMTIRRARRELAGLPFVIEDQSTRWLRLDLSKIPGLGEIATWHVQFLLRKI